MKLHLLFFCLAIATACKTSKEVIIEEEKEVVITEEKQIQLVGKIIVGEACVYIETQEDGKRITLYPVNLEDQLKQNGLKISFTYNISRAPQPENCLVDKVVSLENVTQIR